LKSEFLLVAQRLLQKERRPLSAREIVDIAQRQQLFSDNVAGQTPSQTMKSKLSVHIRRFGDESPFVRTEAGRFYLRELLDSSATPFQATRVRPPTSKERVLAFATEEMDRVSTWQGLRTKWKGATKKILRMNPQYRPRFEIEQDNSFTQVVTYVLVFRRGAILSFRRGTYNRVDQFLRGAYCIGFGGHVSEEDLTLFNSSSLGIFECAARELSEELRLPDADRDRLRDGQSLKIVGLINDDSSEVGRRHLAVVLRYEVTEDPYWDRPERGEKGITQLRWVSADTSPLLLWNFEYWSQLCLRAFASGLTVARPAFRIIRKAPLRPPHILCVLGPVGSGKTMATAILREEFGYVELNTGKVVAQLLGIPPVPETPRAEFQEKAWEFINSQDGPGRLAIRLVEMAHEAKSPRILIDGIRQRSTLSLLRKISSPSRLGLVFVQTPADLAYSFYTKRLAEGASIGDFLAARSSPVETEIDDLIEEADAVLYNWTGKLEYRSAIRSMITELGIGE
jgi:predicted NUDIX family phosphoesterase